MNILIITTYFPPDTAIAAVRPYMFAKYLIQFGHKVTVLRSGEINNMADHFFDPIPGLRIISFLGESSPAEIFSRGEDISFPPPQSRISFLPQAIRIPIAKAYHTCAKPLDLLHMIQNAKAKFFKQQKSLHTLRDEGMHFDAIFATYANLENVYAGEYASKLFHCPWVLDFRDPIAESIFVQGPLLSYLKHIQDQAVSKADACTVVADIIRKSSRGLQKSSKVVTLYNGYEPTQKGDGHITKPGILSICYTGQLYQGKRDITPLLKALKQLSSEGKIDLNHICIDYAGLNFECMQKSAKILHMESLLVNHGYVERSEANRLQKSTDIFLVLDWNTKAELGGMNGKFYEGIRCGRPILALIDGDVPDSELYLINQHYHYGFCYEEARSQEHFPQLCDFLLQAYTQKMEKGKVDYTLSDELSTTFCYDTLTKQLETLMENLVHERLQAAGD